jgi:tRNA(Arg) A34 adenosine deaminase TadA
MSEREEKFMKMAVTLSRQGMDSGHGGPFGAVVVRGDEVIGTGYNRVLSDRDPTAHAEIVAIREACSKTTDFSLQGCEIYTSCEPCPMCLGAIYWARPDKVYYANTRDDAAAAGFDDAFIYEQLQVPAAARRIPMIAVDYPEAIRVFDSWREKPDKHPY